MSYTLKSFGIAAYEYISDAVAHTPTAGYTYIAIQFTSDSAIAALAPAPSGNAIAAASMPKGVIIYGQFTSITLTSGTAIVYMGVV